MFVFLIEEAGKPKARSRVFYLVGTFPSAISTQAKIMKQGRRKGAGEERESETETDRDRHRATRDKDTETGRDRDKKPTAGS